MGKYRLIKMKDRVSSNDTIVGGLRGEVIFGTGRKEIPFIDPFGNQSYHTEFENVLYKDKNIVLIGGYQFVFSKLFNIGLDKEDEVQEHYGCTLNDSLQNYFFNNSSSTIRLFT